MEGGGKLMLLMFKTRFGVPGIISVMALVFAMFGGAYAASNSGGGSHATVSAKSKKGPRGPRGPKGAKGDTGPAGPQGLAGANGKDGTNGTNGTGGAAGKSVSLSAIAAGEAECEERGGVAVGVEGSALSKEVCNGEEGSPWTAGGILPSGATETGVFSGFFNEVAEIEGEKVGNALVPLSFPIPLGEPLDNESVHVAPAGNCTGTAAAPTAEPGELCVYVAEGGQPLESITAPIEGGEVGASTSGATLAILLGPANSPLKGTFAVTAP
jgi:hypothetical protein